MRFPIGLEICKEYIKLARVRFGGKNTKHFDCIVESITSLSDEQIVQRITKILRNERLKPKSAVICLPRDFITVRNLHLPSRDTQEIAQMIDLHIARVVPYKKEEIVFSHQFLGIDEMGYAKEFLAIVHIDVIRRQTRILEKAGLNIDKIILSSYGSWQWVINNHRSEINRNDLYLLLDIDLAFTDFIIFSSDNLLFTRSIPIKISEGLSETDITKFIGEVRQSLVIFQNEEINKRPTKIFLTGSKMATDLYDVIEDELGVPVKLVSTPYPEELLKEKKRSIPKDASLIAVTESILEENGKGLSFSFILPEIQIRKALREKMRELTILGALIIYFFTAITAFFLGKLYNQQVYLKKLNQLTELIKQDIGGLLNQSRKIEVIKDLLRLRKLPLTFLYELQKIVPNEISVDLITLDETNLITLRGQAYQLSDVFKFITVLENSKYFKNVSTRYTRTRKVRDKEVTNFEITFQLTI